MLESTKAGSGFQGATLLVNEPEVVTIKINTTYIHKEYVLIFTMKYYILFVKNLENIVCQNNYSSHRNTAKLNAHIQFSIFSVYMRYFYILTKVIMDSIFVTFKT